MKCCVSELRTRHRQHIEVRLVIVAASLDSTIGQTHLILVWPTSWTAAVGGLIVCVWCVFVCVCGVCVRACVCVRVSE